MRILPRDCYFQRREEISAASAYKTGGWGEISQSMGRKPLNNLGIMPVNDCTVLPSRLSFFNLVFSVFICAHARNGRTYRVSYENTLFFMGHPTDLACTANISIVHKRILLKF